MPNPIYRNLFALLTCLFLLGTANAAVTEWKMIKALDYQQTEDNSSTLNGGVLDIEIVTETVGDATSVTISGGGISGSHAFEQEDEEWFLEMDFASEAALDAEFPSGTTYTITLSGGTLGTLTQTVNFPGKAYPNLPYLTGTEFTKMQMLDPSSDFTMAFTAPGSLTATSGRTGFGIYDLADENDFLYHGEIGAASSFNIQVSEFDMSLVAGIDYLGFIEFTHAAWASGIGGFGVDGTVSHNRSVEFNIRAATAPTGGVVSWDFLKAKGGEQTADNVAPTVQFYVIDSEIELENSGDATSVSISGGGISGSIAYELEYEYWSFEREYNSESEMDAEFPSNTTYTITLSGGTLGTLTQTVVLGAKAYPSLPTFDGTTYSDLQALDASSLYQLSWSSPTGGATHTEMEIEYLVGDEDSPFKVNFDASQTTSNIPANALDADTDYEGYIDHFTVATGTDTGFGVDGIVSYDSFTKFDVSTAVAAPGSVVSWDFIKGQGATQDADNTAPGITDWDIDSEVITERAGDATSVTISGGGISGSLAYEQDGAEWSFHKGYGTEDAVDSEFPSNSTYTITLSGGTLGTLTQTVNLGPKAYPTHPVLTGTTLFDLQSLDPDSAYQMTFNAPGASANRTEIEIEFIDSDEDSPFFSNFDSSLGTTSTIPANSLPGDTTFEAYIDHFKVETASGAGGFGVDGTIAYDSFSGFSVTTNLAEQFSVELKDFNGSTSNVVLTHGTPFVSETVLGSYEINDTSSTYTITLSSGGVGTVDFGGGDINDLSWSVDGAGRIRYTETDGFDDEWFIVITPIIDDNFNVLLDISTPVGQADSADITVLANLVPAVVVPAGSVVSWNFIKGQGAMQLGDNTISEITDWDIDSEVVTENAGDATSVTISGGGISGSLLYEQDGTEWSFHRGYGTEATVDAEFPSSSTYTITLSGGALGTLTQSVNLGAKAYPTHPVLTGSTQSGLRSLNPNAAFEISFNAPGASANRTEIEIELVNSDEDSPFFRNFDSSLGTTSTIPANSLPGDTSFEAYIDHFKAETASGTGGFGVDGTIAYDAFTSFNVITTASTSTVSLSPIVGAWQFGDGGSEPSGVLVFLENGTYFHAEDTEATDEGFDGMERGTYTWNAATGVLIATPILDTNGDIGLSHPLSPFVLVVNGDQLVGGDEPGDPGVLNRVVPVDGVMTGAWQFGDGGDEPSGVVVFLANGTYFHAEDTEATDEGWDGMERGTYTWNSTTGVLVATPILDTNGDIGLSHPLSPFVFSIDGDSLLGGDGEDVGLVRVGLEGASIADAGLEQALRDALDKQAGRLTVLDLQSLMTLNASSRMISSLEGLEDARELQTLDLSNNQISDIGPIAGLEKLVILNISSNLLSDTVQGQSAPENEGQMSLFSVSIQAETLATGTLSPLSGITTLETLLLANNQISDLSSLTTLTLLEEVDLSGNDVTDIGPLATLAALKVVDFSDNEITDLAPLANLANLEEVTLFDNPVDLTEGSSQLAILEQLEANTGAVIVTVASDVVESVLDIEYDESTGISQLIWTEAGILQTSMDMDTWMDVPSASSPYEIAFDPEGPKFWRIKEQ